MGSAVAAGAISDIICNPMFVVRTRLQTEAVHNNMIQFNTTRSTIPNSIQLQPPTTTNPIRSVSSSPIVSSSMWETIKVLYGEGGILSFWRGMTANLLGLSHVAIQFPAYEYLKHQLLIRRQDNQNHSNNSTNRTNCIADIVEHNTAMELLLASALSKMIASIVTYPHEVIRSRMMDARSPGSAIRLGFISTCSKIYRTEQISGFYAGLPISLIRVIPNTCLTFITYELFLRYSREQILSMRQYEASDDYVV
jgi:solute carrier family 25 (mitochondrial folate transporter), member 32